MSDFSACGEQPATIELSGDEALVLFELLARWSDLDTKSKEIPPVALLDSAEWHAMSVLQCLLEKHLVAPFKTEYGELVAKAKGAIIEWGGERLERD